jgi:poly(3-hydroxybutyrate) depolymerase
MRPASPASLVLPILLVLATAAAPARGETVRPLPALGIALEETTVSGISSGAFMAGQFQIAHSRIVKGAAIIAGGPYGCAEALATGFLPGLVKATLAVQTCMLHAYAFWGRPSVTLLAERIGELARAGRIDPPEGIARHRLYLFSGSRDQIVQPSIVEATVRLYRRLGVPDAAIQHVTRYPAGHAIITEDEGGACEVSKPPFVVDCDYDQAGSLLAHLYGALRPRVGQPTGEWITFDQQPFTASLGTHSMAEAGTLYVPADCIRQPGCRIHVAFHGCMQNRTAVGDAFVRGAGFHRWADTNRIVVLFPEAAVSFANPQGCWDWWGYSGSDFPTRDGAQIKTVRRMLDRLAARP